MAGCYPFKPMSVDIVCSTGIMRPLGPHVLESNQDVFEFVETNETSLFTGQNVCDIHDSIKSW